MAFLPPIHDPSTPILTPIQQEQNTQHWTNVPVSESIHTAIPSSSHKTGISFVQGKKSVVTLWYREWRGVYAVVTQGLKDLEFFFFTFKFFFYFFFAKSNRDDGCFENINSISSLLTEQHFWNIPQFWVSSLFCFFVDVFLSISNTHTHVWTCVMRRPRGNRKYSDSQYWEYWKDLSLICLRCSGAWEEITDSKDAHVYVATSAFWSSDSISASSPPLNPEIVIIYHKPVCLPGENKSLAVMFRSYSIQCNFTASTIAGIKMRGSSVAWISAVTAEEETWQKHPLSPRLISAKETYTVSRPNSNGKTASR